ncbi:DUF2953 domain-containing protein [Oceanobacillus halotolerans]|uniref:DUF2953 domain-containing protein n=1 Tax=Oceanobacillus halotolerans TaxID=2663380 RepID=UPI0013D8EDA8|nr:DUF2953 domain-containing protein [Oceanobacillus halotolerans]
MVWILIGVVLVILILIIILLFSTLTISIHSIYDKERSWLSLRVLLYKIPILQTNIDFKEQQDIGLLEEIEEKSFLEKLRFIYHQLQYMAKLYVETKDILFQYLVANTFVHQLEWETHIGTGDAASTGITTGGIWTIKGLILGVVIEKSNLLNKPTISVVPYFQQEYFHSRMKCMVSIRLGKAIRALYKMIRSIPAKEKLAM